MSTDAAPGVDAGVMTSRLNCYFAGVALTLCVYDWLILIERESQTAWKARWTRTKAIYYINRVISLVGLIITVIQNTDLWTYPLSQRFCKFYVWFVPMLQLLSSCLGNFILTLRVIALYNRHVVITRILYTLLVLDWLLILARTIHTVYLWSLDINYVASLHGCVSTVTSPSEPAIFVAAALFEVILFFFTLYRAILDYRRGLVTGYSGSRFLFILYRDGFYYFAAVSAVQVWNALEYLLAPMSDMLMGVYFTWAMMTVMSSRVYLNLILAAHGGGRDDLTTGGLSSFRDARVNHPEGTGGEIVTFSAKRGHRRIPLTTFTMTVFSAEYNTQPDAIPDSQGEWSEGAVTAGRTLVPEGEEL